MDKAHIVQFLREKQRGIYTVIARSYMDMIIDLNVTIALKMITEDLEKSTGEKVSLNYFSLNQAIAKHKKENGLLKREMNLKPKPEAEKKMIFQKGDQDANLFDTDIPEKLGYK